MKTQSTIHDFSDRLIPVIETLKTRSDTSPHYESYRLAFDVLSRYPQTIVKANKPLDFTSSWRLLKPLRELHSAVSEDPNNGEVGELLLEEIMFRVNAIAQRCATKGFSRHQATGAALSVQLHDLGEIVDDLPIEPSENAQRIRVRVAGEKLCLQHDPNLDTWLQKDREEVVNALNTGKLKLGEMGLQTVDEVVELGRHLEGKVTTVNLGSGPPGLRDDDLRKILEAFPFMTTLVLPPFSKVTHEAMGTLKGIATLKELYLSACIDNPTAWTELRGMAQLEKLALPATGVFDLNIGYVATFPNLKSLNLNLCYELTDIGLGVLQLLPNLEELYIGGIKGISAEGLKMLKHVPRLHTLDVGCKFRGNLSEAALESIGALPNLRVLTFSSKTLTDEGVASLPNLDKLEKLTMCPEFSGEDRAMGTLLRKCPNLRWLNLQFAKGLSNHTLSAISDLSHLKWLNLEGDNGPILPRTFAKLARLTHLETLNLNKNCTFTYSHVALLHPLQKLKALHLGHATPLTDDGLRNMKAFVDLESLTFSRGMTDEGLSYLKDLPNLKTLHIRDCAEISAEGFESIAKLPNLETLYLGFLRNLGPDGISALKDCRELKTLTLNSVATNDGFLEVVRDLPHLKEVYFVRCTGLTIEGLEELKLARPDLSITGAYNATRRQP